MKIPRSSSLFLILCGFALPALASRLARAAAGAGYSAVTHSEPPRNPATLDVRWREAVLWTIFSGALGGIAQLIARRWLAKARIPAEGFDMHKQLRRAIA